ncbi:MAG: cysteine--tRNA ligase [Deltaproteobacteria bacterium]
MGLRVFDTRTREKVDFNPLEPGKVRMYVCGVTVYAPTHIGHGRCYVAFDVVYRWLKTQYLVTYVRNFTDVDDKIIKAANANGETTDEVTNRFIAQFSSDMSELGCLEPNIEPRVTTHIAEIVAMIETLIAKGFAYDVDGDVYFEVAKYDAYGALSGRKLDEQEEGARVAVDTRKRAAADFALWKSAKPGEPSWDSPWGKGRPGWHIECSAMSGKYLGEVFDIHAGGKDLVFPHHENELAQSCAANGTELMANIWMHNGFVNLMPEKCPGCDTELENIPESGHHCACGYTFTEMDFKMSKSRGNFYPVREMLAQYEGEALRMLFLTSQYRSPIAFSHDLLDAAEKRLDKNYETLEAMDAFTNEQTFVPGKNLAATFDVDPWARFTEAMNDDFNTPRALAEAAEVFHIANELIHGQEKARIGEVLSPENTSRLLAEARVILRQMGDVLGLWQADPKAYLERRKLARSSSLQLTPAQIEAFIEERKEARAKKDFKRADEIRDELKAKGIILKDGKDGTTWDAAD